MKTQNERLVELYKSLEKTVTELSNLRRNPGSNLAELKVLEAEILTINEEIQEVLNNGTN
jgi:hypothetical protein